jgi:hypothetical protein
MHLPPQLIALASNQHGLFTRHQARDHGIDRHRLRRGVERGELRRVSHSVFAIAAAPATELQAVLAAVLDHGPGASASHHTALAMFGQTGFELLPAHILIPRSVETRSRGLSIAHTTRWIRTSHVTRLHGIPVTTPTRTPFDIAQSLHPKRLELTIDRLASRRLTSYQLLHDMLDDVAHRGRPLTQLMRTILDERPPEYVPPESGLEARFEQIVREAGITTLDRQVDIGDDTTWLGRMDFRDRDLPYVVQIDSDLYHSALVDRVRDREQTVRLEAAGLVVDRIREFDVWHRRQAVVETVQAGRARAASRRAPQPV